MKLIVDKKIMKYYQHLNELNHDGIAKQALEISKSLRAANKKFFMSYYERLVQMYNNNNIICSKSDVNKAYNKMRINYLSYWKSKVEHSTKLEFFRSQNTTHSQAKYLSSVRQFKIRQATTKLRISNHALMIEIGRYQMPKVPKDRRLCSLCDQSKIEDENHFLFECPTYEILRRKLITNSNTKIESFMNNSELKSLMESEDQSIHILIATFIHNLFKHRNNLINP